MSNEAGCQDTVYKTQEKHFKHTTGGRGGWEKPKSGLEFKNI